MEKTIEKIAKDILMISTLKPRNLDNLDFHIVAVWDIKKALELAYEEGKKDKERKNFQKIVDSAFIPL